MRKTLMKWWRSDGGVREVVTLLGERIDVRRDLAGGEEEGE
jgi:hypothetical protein